jgi:hypothetical protein
LLLERKLRLDNAGPRSLSRIQPACARYIDEPSDIPDTPRTLEEATNDIVKFIDAHKAEISEKISALRRAGIRSPKIPVIIKRVFKCFNENVFAGKLQGRVSFRGFRIVGDRELIRPNDSGKTIATFTGRQGAGIILNCEAFSVLLETREPSVAHDLLIAAVVHQMIHT